VVFALRKKGRFEKRWYVSPRRTADAPALRRLLEQEGARGYSLRQAHRLTQQALTQLRALRPEGPAGTALTELTEQLLGRRA